MTPAGLLRTLLPTRLLARTRSAAVTVGITTAPTGPNAARCEPTTCLRECRCFAAVHDIDKLNRDVYFNSTAPRHDPTAPPDERTLQLGRTIRTLHERLPTLLQSPLPQDILSSNITLHLFPSTHPHLPTVSGRIAYIAALWTAPVAWGRVPLVGNVGLTILSERVVKNGVSSSSAMGARGDEKLIVKWKTCGKAKSRDSTGGVYGSTNLKAKDPVDKIRDFIAGTRPRTSDASKPDAREEFTGLFIFEFDAQGKIVKHVIEHTEEGGRWDHMTRVVSVTDWLLGNLSGKKKVEEQMPGLAWCEERPTGWGIRIVDRSNRQ